VTISENQAVKALSVLPDGAFRVAMRPGSIVMGSLLYFVHRNARVAMTLGVVVFAVSMAGAIGWMTAPV
jgi:hypothetical protein